MIKNGLSDISLHSMGSLKMIHIPDCVHLIFLSLLAEKGNADVSIFKQLKVPILVLITATTVYLVARNYHSFLHFLSFKRK